MYTKKISDAKNRNAIQYMAFGAGKPVAPFAGRQISHGKQGDPASMRESRYPQPSFFEQRYRPEE